MKKLKAADFDIFAEEFDRTRARLWREATDFIDAQPKGSFVLDIGSGGGRHALYSVKVHRTVALDISRKMIKIMKEKDCGVLAVVADATALPFKENTFDAVIYVAAIHHIETNEGRIQSLGEIQRILNRGGKFIASAWALEQEKFSKLADKNGNFRHTWDKKFPRFYHLFREGEFLRISKEAGFTKLKEWKSGDNWWIEGTKK